MISRYDLMKTFDEVNEDGGQYNDIFSYPSDDSVIKGNNPNILAISTREKQRIDLSMFEAYETTSWDDIILWYNNIATITETSLGDNIDLPTGDDLSVFYEANVVTT